ncbi:MAG: NAD(P)-dependent oxidoreductase [Deltaproteobacteria bacterium]|nr:NAD(P)-dependent oxidoreductase [Deltaproteobacteria bacterium]
MNKPGPSFNNCVLFGGSGFIGLHLARHLLDSSLADKIWLADIRAPRGELFPANIQQMLASGKVEYLEVDVRRKIEHAGLPDRAELVVNLAAVHREPGHQPHEYYETNLYGAENVCAWAEEAGCLRVVFTSSIAPYGPSEEPRDENSLPVPRTPYGGSKLAAEKIHLAWQRGAGERRLLIVRPGVVFGPGEGGNVTRLVRAVLGRYFVYTGNQGTRKAGGYVKELCRTITWALERLNNGPAGVILYNFTMNPPASVAEFVEGIQLTAGKRRLVPAVPYRLLLAGSYVIEALARPLGIRQPVSPVRVKKLVFSNHIRAAWLKSQGYDYQYTLEQALADWRDELPRDWS